MPGPTVIAAPVFLIWILAVPVPLVLPGHTAKMIPVLPGHRQDVGRGAAGAEEGEVAPVTIPMRQMTR